MPTCPVNDTERELQFFILNAFVLDCAKSLQQGNPAAVVLLPPTTIGLPLSNELMQSIATQLNISETAFVSWVTAPQSHDLQHSFHIRWFTPKCEVDLCGHATLAAAAALLAAEVVRQESTVHFTTQRKGTLQVCFEDRQGLPAKHKFAKMTFPIIHARQALSDVENEAVLQALRVPSSKKPVRVLRSEFDIVVELQSAADVALLAPDMALLQYIDTRGIIVCAKNGSDVDGSIDDDIAIVSRFFAPRAGIAEDPVTGSAHCVLASLYLSEGSGCVCRQLSARGGRLEVFRSGTDRVHIGGLTRVVAGGSLYL